MTTKVADSKGRVALGRRFANKPVIIQEVDATEVRVIVAAVVPERELWLHDNAQAKRAVQQGLAQAKARKFSKQPPDIAGDAKLAQMLDG